MAVGTFTMYYNGKEVIAKALVDLDTDSFKAGLSTSSYTPSASAHTVTSDITNEVSGGSYAQVTIGALTVTRSSATVTVDSADVNFGSSTTITAKWFWLYDNTPATKYLIGYCDLETGGGSVSSTSSSFVVTTGSGYWTMT